MSFIATVWYCAYSGGPSTEYKQRYACLSMVSSWIGRCKFSQISFRESYFVIPCSLIVDATTPQHEDKDRIRAETQSLTL